MNQQPQGFTQNVQPTQNISQPTFNQQPQTNNITPKPPKKII